MDELISRQVALDALAENEEMINAVLDSLTLDYNTRRNLEQRRGQINEDIETIKELPSAEPKRGKWINDGKPYALYQCSACNDFCTVVGYANCIPEERMYKTMKYCPNCGAKMEC